MTMSPELNENPFAAPQRQDSGLQTPGVLAILFITFLSVGAGVCTFFCTCFGSLLIVRMGNEAAFLILLIAAVLALVLALLTARATYAKLYAMLSANNTDNQKQ